MYIPLYLHVLQNNICTYHYIYTFYKTTYGQTIVTTRSTTAYGHTIVFTRSTKQHMDIPLYSHVLQQHMDEPLYPRVLQFSTMDMALYLHVLQNNIWTYHYIYTFYKTTYGQTIVFTRSTTAYKLTTNQRYTIVSTRCTKQHMDMSLYQDVLKQYMVISLYPRVVQINIMDTPLYQHVVQNNIWTFHYINTF